MGIVTDIIKKLPLTAVLEEKIKQLEAENLVLKEEVKKERATREKAEETIKILTEGRRVSAERVRMHRSGNFGGL